MIGIAGGIALFSIAFFASCLSAVATLGGGTLLFRILFLIVDFALVMPIFGIVQTASATSRVWFFRQYIDRSIFSMFFVGFIPAAILGGLFWSYSVNNEEIQPYIMMLIAVHLLLFLKFPKFSVPRGNKTWLLIAMGIVAGLASLTVGAIGPVIVPFIDALGLKKERAVAAIGAVSFFGNLIKLPLVFLIVDHIDWSIATITGGMVVGSILGVYFGRCIHGRVNESFFIYVFRIVLFLMPAKLLIWDGLRVVLG